MELQLKKTNRGFAVAEFTDLYGSECSIQKSSLADEEAIWLGVNDANPQILASQTAQGGNGWVPFPLPDGVHLSTRMHLNREMAAALIPILQHFVETGELPVDNA